MLRGGVMADPESYDKSEPEPLVSVAEPQLYSGTDALQSVAQHQSAMAAASLNVAPAPKLESAPALPNLPVRQVTGYTLGKPTQINVVKVGGFTVEENTAYDFLTMRRYAAKDGILLVINSSFRSMETQIELWNARTRPAYVPRMQKPPRSEITLTAEGVRLGPAAFPGYSNHQSGVALDLKTGMTITDRLSGRFSAIFLWLQKNATLFGFDNDDVPTAKPEPWHWRHKEQRFVSESLARELREDYYGTLINSDASATAALKQGMLSKGAYDKVMAHKRSAAAANSSLEDLCNANVAEKICTSAETQRYVAELVRQQSTLEDPPPKFAAETLNPYTYDFETGLWGDKKAV